MTLSLKVGMDYDRVRTIKNTLPIFFKGSYVFTSLAPFQAGTPTSYSVAYGNPTGSYPLDDLSFFAQDDWRVTPRLVMKGGLRYQRQFWTDLGYSVSTPGNQRFSYSVPEDTNNVAPRVSAAWDVTGNGKTSVHASYGLQELPVPGLVHAGQGGEHGRRLHERAREPRVWPRPREPDGIAPRLGFDPNYDRGPSLNLDLRHRLVVSGFYRAPMGFLVSGVVTRASGAPFTAGSGTDFNQNGDTGDRARTNPADPATEVRRNTERARGTLVANARVSKRFNLGKGTADEGIFEVFNLFDRANFGSIDGVFGPGAFPGTPRPTYAQYTTAAARRSSSRRGSLSRPSRPSVIASAMLPALAHSSSSGS